MKPVSRYLIRSATVLTSLLLGIQFTVRGDPATVLFQDDFTGGIPGWTAVQPAGAYTDGPMLWQYDRVSGSFSEQSNIYTDNSTASTSRRAVMLIHETVAPASFTYTARLTAGDDDGFGLIWGYESESTFYRVAFGRQSRTGWPHTGLIVDRLVNGAITDLAGPDGSFVNTAGRPFDVTISVASGRLTLTIVDDPLGAAGGPIAYNPVTDLVLPTASSGRVGMFSWGMAAGTPRSFRIQNPVLNGVALDAAASSQVLSNWSFTTTLSATNDWPNVGLWSQALGVNGDRGVMLENNDQAPENTAFSYTNCPVYAALAGDVNWSNYVYSARITTSDDDGFGLLLRYQNRSNWYRIAFRNQSTASGGIRRGISVQKSVDRTFDQMLASTAFIPPVGSPFDVHAAVRDDVLQILCVQNPDTASPVITSFGPIDMAASTLVPGTLDTGLIGAFSWAQFNASVADDGGTQVDWVKVRAVNGEGLFISSVYGTPEPPVGLNDIPNGTVVTGTVPSVVTTAPGVRQLSTGWTGVGSVPASGATNEVVFTMSSFSSIAWNWKTQYLLDVTATAGGSVGATLGPWINPGSNVTVTATANPGYVFTGWSGDSLSTFSELNFQVVRPITLRANFAADSDNDKLPDHWEMQYWGSLAQNGTDDSDADTKNNLLEYELGTNPKYTEGVVFTEGLTSRWINESRDRALPGWFAVTNFGSGFRGLWEFSNQNRAANSAGPYDAPFITTTNYGTNASFQGPLILVRTDAWNPAWANTFSLSADYSLGDDDGACLYFRYLNESNWFRVTLCAQANTADPTRPLDGVTVQKRTNGWFSAVPLISDSGSVPLDPLDGAGPIPGFKRVRVTVNGTNDAFEVRVIGWDVLGLNPPDWNPSFERVITFADNSLPTGRIGVGDWGMDGFGAWNSTTNNPNQPGIQMNPVGAGGYVDNILLQVDGTNAFVEDWETATLHADFPAGWENPYSGLPPGGLLGDWHVSAHGTIAGFTAAFGTSQTGTPEFPKADVEGPILLAPALTNRNYALELGIQPMDDGGMGFVYDFRDTNNFARVLFNSQAPAAGELAQGLSIGRKANGIWTDIVVGDSTFIYTPGRQFDVRFANNNGAYTLSAWNTDVPAVAYHWQWTDLPVTPSNRIGVAIWNMPDAHFAYLRAYGLPVLVPSVPFEITGVSLDGGNVTLEISKPAGASYHVLRAAAVDGLYSTVAVNQASAQYSEAAPAGTAFYKLQLVP